MPRRTSVLIEAAEWRDVVLEAFRQFPLETGGVLMGSWTSKRQALVTDIIGPGRDALHTASSFEPDQAWQECEVERVWRVRSGVVSYLGDWHTHPRGGTRASRDDLSAALRIAGSPEAKAPRPIMLVVAVSSGGALKPQPFVFTGPRLAKAALLLNTEARDR